MRGNSIQHTPAESRRPLPRYPWRGDPSGFTLLELVIVIGVFCAALLLVFPALTSKQERANRATCAGNIRQQLVSFLRFADDNMGVVHAGPNLGFLWDLSFPHRDLLINEYELTRDAMYCPSYPEHNADAMWEYNGSFTVTGYWMVIHRTSVGFPILRIRNQKYIEEVIVNGNGYVSVLADVVHPSRTVMIADATMSNSFTNFTGIAGGLGFVHRSPHLEPDSPLVAGMNTGHVDGSVAWKPFLGSEDNLMITQSPLVWW